MNERCGRGAFSPLSAGQPSQAEWSPWLRTEQEASASGRAAAGRFVNARTGASFFFPS